MKINLKIGAQIAFAVIAFGWSWIADNQTLVVGFLATLLIWGFDAATKYKIVIGKFWKTVAVFVVALILQVLISPLTIPAFPGWDIAMLVSYVGEWFTVIQGVALASMTIYNLLLAQVLGAGTEFLKSKFAYFR